jgi:hypothetical protein
MASPMSKISSFAYEEMSSPASKVSSFAYEDMPSPAFEVTSVYSDMPSPGVWMTTPVKKSAFKPEMSSIPSKQAAINAQVLAAKAQISATNTQMTPTKAQMSSTKAQMSPAKSQMSVKPRTASMDSKCTTFSDIIRALDETHDRIASMGVDELKKERVDSLYLLDDGQPKHSTHRAYDTKKYMASMKKGEITLREIQIAVGGTKLPEEHVADWIAINGSEYLMFFLTYSILLTILQSFLSPLMATASAPTTLTLALPSADATPSPATSRVPSRKLRTSSSEAKRYVQMLLARVMKVFSDMFSTASSSITSPRCLLCISHVAIAVQKWLDAVTEHQHRGYGGFLELAFTG